MFAIVDCCEADVGTPITVHYLVANAVGPVRALVDRSSTELQQNCTGSRVFWYGDEAPCAYDTAVPGPRSRRWRCVGLMTTALPNRTCGGYAYTTELI